MSVEEPLLDGELLGLSAATQSRYETLVRDTFDAFKPSSRVPGITQLDLLEFTP